jgi:hypothetical protein
MLSPASTRASEVEDRTLARARRLALGYMLSPASTRASEVEVRTLARVRGVARYRARGIPLSYMLSQLRDR